MRNWMYKGLAVSLACAIAVPFLAPAQGLAAADKTTKYRVYQFDQPVKEFQDYNQAVAYAQYFYASRVEEISTGAWKWDNYPRYQVYQLDYALPDGAFRTLEEAVAEASKWGVSSVRDLQGSGWVWNNYPRYRVYQGDATLDGWSFTTLNAAIAEARKWGGAHIIDLSDNRWIWDNLSNKEKAELRNGQPAYQVYQGTYSQDSWRFAYLEDAVNEALKWGGSQIVRIADKKTVFTNFKEYKVYQNENFLDEFVNLDQAADYARLWGHSTIRLNGKIIWNNYPTYTVYQNSNLIGEYNKLSDALSYASYYSNASIRSREGMKFWNNFRALQIWSWNGSSAKSTIDTQTSNLMGLDVDSPSWFTLEDATGKLKDASSKETVDLLRSRGYQVHPLVSNQFDSTLTSQFLADKDAQARFISALVAKSAQLRVDGINVDFESLNGKDRAAFTTFITNLTTAAHQQGLKISVDLPRGSVKWNHLTAFDHEKLGSIVDYIITMTYDQHYSGSTVPGSVAGLQWVEEGIEEFLSYGIPRDKLILGIPFYVREWTLDANGGLLGNKALYSRDLKALMASRPTVSTWDKTFNQYKVEYYGDDGNKRVFWLENQESVKARLELAKKYDLVGVAAWRLGQEDPAFWETILQNK